MKVCVGSTESLLYELSSKLKKRRVKAKDLVNTPKVVQTDVVL